MIVQIRGGPTPKFGTLYAPGIFEGTARRQVQNQTPKPSTRGGRCIPRPQAFDSWRPAAAAAAAAAEHSDAAATATTAAAAAAGPGSEDGACGGGVS